MSEDVRNDYENLWDEGKKKKSQTTTQKVEFNENNYLNTRLKKGETSRQLKIRLLTTLDVDGKYKLAIPVEVHSLKLNQDQEKISASGFKSFICLNDDHIEGNDKGCPLCEKRKELFDNVNSIKNKKKELTQKIESASDEETKQQFIIELKSLPSEEQIKAMIKEAYKYDTKTAYIVRCIERGHEEDGVKFWRFNKRDDGSGIYDELKTLAENRMQESIEAGAGKYNMYNYEDGLDLTLTLSQAEKKNPAAPDKTAIKIDVASLRTPLSRDKELAESWINDPKDWRDMYRTKSYDYLKIVADGKSPYMKDGQWVAWVDMRDENQKAEEEAKQELRAAQPTFDEQTTEEELPF